jgi:excisionase family DNA binding protein
MNGRAHSKTFYTILEVAELLGVHERTVRRWIKPPDGELPAHRIGGVVRIADGDLQAFLASRRR